MKDADHYSRWAPRSDKWDAYFYPITGEWIEPACGDPDCEFCANRPKDATGEPEYNPAAYA